MNNIEVYCGIPCETKNNALKHYKYIKRYKKNGKWRYVYPDVKSKVKNAVNKAGDAILKKANELPSAANKVVNKTKESLIDLYDDKNNVYDLTSLSYDKKTAEIWDSKEWQNILSKKDPEYVRTLSDGTTQYLFDKYLVDKKHPILDALGDVASNRDISVNEITKDSAVAGLKDYARGTISTGVMAVSIATKLMTEKFKLQQGSYDAQINSLIASANDGAAYVNDSLATAGSVDKDEAMRLAMTLAKNAKKG